MTSTPTLRIDRYLRDRPAPRDAKTLVCVGDSITQGQISSNWVDTVASGLRASDYRVVNAGANGELAWNVLQRLDAVIECKPDAVTLLVGTNDVSATNSPEQEAYYRKHFGLPKTPTLRWYVDCVGEILRRLRAETTATVLLLGLPMIGEDLTSVMNTRVRAYNDALSALAHTHDVDFLPTYEPLSALLPARHTPPPYAAKTRTVIISSLRHGVLRQSWNTISKRHGLAVTTDHVHLNDRAGAIVAGLVEERLSRKATT